MQKTKQLAQPSSKSTTRKYLFCLHVWMGAGRMISKIIQKEKAQQEKYFKEREFNCIDVNLYCAEAHKQFLINLRDHIIANRKKIMREVNSYEKCYCAGCSTKIYKFLEKQEAEDIKELNKMIKQYE
jgi:hypothetical protein